MFDAVPLGPSMSQILVEVTSSRSPMRHTFCGGAGVGLELGVGVGCGVGVGSDVGVGPGPPFGDGVAADAAFRIVAGDGEGEGLGVERADVTGPGVGVASATVVPGGYVGSASSWGAPAHAPTIKLSTSIATRGIFLRWTLKLPIQLIPQNEVSVVSPRWIPPTLQFEGRGLN